jgi:hypothetical protein
MPWNGSYEELESYLREFVNIPGEHVPYDFGGGVGLFLATLDNVRTNALDAELEDLRERLIDEQAAFLVRLASLIRNG